MSVSGSRVAATTITANANHGGVTRLSGFSIRESAAVAAVAAVNLRHANSTGQILAVLELAADQSATLLSPAVIHAPNGVYVQVVTGTVSGVLYGAEWSQDTYI